MTAQVDVVAHVALLSHALSDVCCVVLVCFTVINRQRGRQPRGEALSRRLPQAAKQATAAAAATAAAVLHQLRAL
jgi:hypothetical protein